MTQDRSAEGRRTSGCPRGERPGIAKWGVGENQYIQRFERGRRPPAFFHADGRWVVLDGFVVVVVGRLRAVPLHERRNVAQDGAPGRWREQNA